MTAGVPAADVPDVEQPTERIELLLRDLRGEPGRALRRARPSGGWSSTARTSSSAGADAAGRASSRAQFTHPLALLLWAAAALAWSAGIVPVAIAIVVVIVLNAAFAFVQERQAERAVEALAALPAAAGDGRARRPAPVDRRARARAGRRAGHRGGRPRLAPTRG